jgi:hypothetical protein
MPTQYLHGSEKRKKEVVAKAGIEPPTHGFSVVF